MQRFLISALGLIAALSLAIFGARSIGASQKSLASSLFDTENCSQPCWHGIRPGFTTVSQAETLLTSAPDLVTKVTHSSDTVGECNLTWEITIEPIYAGCIKSQDGLVTDVILRASYDGGISLQEGLLVLGTPTAARVCRPHYGNDVVSYAYITRYIVLSVVYPTSPNKPQPEKLVIPALINAIDYHRPDDQEFENDQVPPLRWHGFTDIPWTYNIGDCITTIP